MEQWKSQLMGSVNSLDRLKKYINVTPEEEEAISTLGDNSVFCVPDGQG